MNPTIAEAVGLVAFLTAIVAVALLTGAVKALRSPVARQRRALRRADKALALAGQRRREAESLAAHYPGVRRGQDVTR